MLTAERDFRNRQANAAASSSLYVFLDHFQNV